MNMMQNAVDFVAEVSSNHYRDLERCFRFVDTSAAIGCTSVKFQLFKIDELFAPEVLARSEKLRQRRQWELPAEFLPELADRCQQAQVEFSCTPFYLKAVEELFPYVDFYKIASYELLWNDLLTECAQTGKPVILSTGMATLEEIDVAVETLRSAGCRELSLLHCVSGYPVPPSQCNLAAISTLRERFSCPVGWSDHSVSPQVVERAIHRWRASTIEFHLDLDGRGEEFTTGHCWLPEQMKGVIKDTKTAFDADGTGEKIPAPIELDDCQWRADSIDGLRPFLSVRKNWNG